MTFPVIGQKHSNEVDLYSLKQKGIWPIFLSSALLGEHEKKAIKIGYSSYNFSLNLKEQLHEWKKQLNACALDRNCKILWAVKGGYGATRIPSVFKKDELDELFSQKLFIGYSDLTVIHQIYASNSWPSIHGALLAESFEQTRCRENINDILRLISQSSKNYQVGPWKRMSHSSEKLKEKIPLLEGKITGGNLSILQSGIGTNWLALKDYSFLFIEDVNIKPHHLDRMFWHLYQSNQIQHFKGIFIGHLGLQIENIENILLSWEQRLDCPFFYNPDLGHGRRNIPLIFHYTCHLKSRDQTTYDIIYKLNKAF
jgi:muramoyltetrapeptide carboxypeptidase